MQISRVRRRWCVALALLAGTVSPAFASFALNLSFVGLTPSQINVFDTARTNWENLITGYQPGIALTGINISAVSAPIDGVGNILGSADPTAFTTQGGFTLSTKGAMQFDSADLADLERTGELEAVAMHEMAHVMGFGTLWTLNGVYIDGTGRYTGTNALNAYRREFDSSAAFVPVELKYGPGTNDGHWEDDITTIHDRQGRPLSSELMTGFIDSPTFLSRTTVQSFADIGFTVRPQGTAAPEPTIGYWVLGIGCWIAAGIAKRRTLPPQYPTPNTRHL